MRIPRTGLVLAALVLAILLSGAALLTQDDPPSVVLDMENAAGLQVGTPVQVLGEARGEITAIDLADDRAQVAVRLEDDAPTLHADARAFVRWRAVLGQRIVEIVPGAEGSRLAKGATLEVAEEQVDVDDVLSALDPATRKQVSKLLVELDGTLGPASQDLNETLEVSGPALEALGQIVDSVSADDQAIREVITQLDAVIAPLAAKDDAVARTVSRTTRTAAAVSREERALSRGLQELPATIDAASRTFRAMGPAVEEARPLLRDLRPVSARLSSVSRRLAPVLVDLRSAIANLRPVLGEVDSTLTMTPGLLDKSRRVFPGLDSTITALVPAVEFLRPYTPDLTGWVSNWGSAYSYYDATGHYASAVIRMGPQAFDDNPGVPLSVDFDPAPHPGTAGRTPWTDANGSSMR